MITSSIADGVSLGPGRCLLVVQPSDTDSSDTEFASLLVQVDDSRVISAAQPKFVVSRVLEHRGESFVVGRLGEFARMTGEAFSRENIHGPEDFGFLIDACVAGDTFYAAGMRRQVYARMQPSGWMRVDGGVLDQSNDVEHVSGFRSIDATLAGELHAVGLEGELWNLHAGVWCSAASPTNVDLEQVRCTPRGDIYAAGQAGVILRGVGQIWTVLEQTSTSDDFWGLEWFGDRLYVATGSQLFVFDEPTAMLQPVAPEGTSFARLRAGHGALWSFGPEEARWSLDGREWNVVDVPKADSRTD